MNIHLNQLNNLWLSYNYENRRKEKPSYKKSKETIIEKLIDEKKPKILQLVLKQWLI